MPAAGVEAVSDRRMATSSKPRSRRPAGGHPRRARTAPARPARRRRSSVLRTTLRAPVLAPHHVDVAALALVAVGVFLGGVAYLHWAGGPLGRGLLDGARLAVGKLAYALAPALAAAGALLLARELRPPTRGDPTG